MGCDHRARTTYPLSCVARLARVLALTRLPPRCAELGNSSDRLPWEAAAALCCGREGVRGGGGGAAGGSPWRCQKEGRSAHAAPAQPLVYAYALSLARRRAAQGGNLPLHFAAAGGASEAVVKRLLAAYPDAAKKKEEVHTHRARTSL